MRAFIRPHSIPYYYCRRGGWIRQQPVLLGRTELSNTLRRTWNEDYVSPKVGRAQTVLRSIHITFIAKRISHLLMAN